MINSRVFMRFLLLIFFVFLIGGQCVGQDVSHEPVPLWIVEPEVAALFEKFVHLNKSKGTLSGWRIQLLASTDRMRVERELVRFRTLYPAIPADWIHQSPYYKLVVGAFESRKEAYRYLYIIRQDYPNAFPARDDSIRPEELLN